MSLSNTAKRLREIQDKFDPKKQPRPPGQGDYLEDVSFLLTLVPSKLFYEAKP